MKKIRTDLIHKTTAFKPGILDRNGVHDEDRLSYRSRSSRASQSPPPLPSLFFGLGTELENPATLIGSGSPSIGSYERKAPNKGNQKAAPSDTTSRWSDGVRMDDNTQYDLNSNNDVNLTKNCHYWSNSEQLHSNSPYSHIDLGHQVTGQRFDSNLITQPKQTSRSNTHDFGAITGGDILQPQHEILALVCKLRSDRSQLLQDIETEERDRIWFETQLDSLSRRQAHLAQTHSESCERWQLEHELLRLQEATVQRLGTPVMIARRREQRLHTINTIEKTIQRLQQESPYSGTLSASGQGLATLRPDLSMSAADIMDALNANQVDTNELSISETLNDSIDSLTQDSTTLGTGQTKDSASLGLVPPVIAAALNGTWPFEKTLWHSSPASMGLSLAGKFPDGPQAIMASSSVAHRRSQSHQQLLNNKVEMVYGLLSMFSSGDRDEMSRTLLAMSSSPESCVAMRTSGCLPLLVQLLHGGDGESMPTRETRLRAAQALHNVVHCHPDDKKGRREARVLRLLEQIRDFSDYLYERLERTGAGAGRGPLLEDEMERHPCTAMAALMKLSFDEDHRLPMCALGGLPAIAQFLRWDHEAHGATTGDQYCISLRRYAGMCLTNLTFGDSTNKALLCSFRPFMRALVSQLYSPNEDLRQVTASVLRNLSWRADSASRTSLREAGAVGTLMQSALSAGKESTLKVMLSAVWNLSAHSSLNKVEICNVVGALSYLCNTLVYKSHSRTLAILENGGGILRNISSHIAVMEDLRQILRDHNTLTVLLGQLRSPSLTVVSNACGTLWNLSARCEQDQRSLWELGAVPMLRSLVHSKHKMISMGASAALKNLLQARPEGLSIEDPRLLLGITGGLPSLQARKHRALEQELDPNLAETCENIESSPTVSPTHVSLGGLPQGVSMPLADSNPPKAMFRSLAVPQLRQVLRSESRESVSSSHSDSSHDRMKQLLLQNNQLPSVVADGPILARQPMDLSFRSRAPSSHGCPDVACLSQDELKEQLEHLQRLAVSSGGEMMDSADELLLKQFMQALGKETGKDAVIDESRQESGETERLRHISGSHLSRHHGEVHHSMYAKYVSHSLNVASFDEEVGNKSDSKLSVLEHGSSSNARQPLLINNYVSGKCHSDSEDKCKDIVDRTPSPVSSCSSSDLGNIDQPTDFSLRYSEERDRDDSKLFCGQKKTSPMCPPLTEDSLKLFCTEGTPFHFSNATSLSDLTESNTTNLNKNYKKGKTGLKGVDESASSLRNMALDDLSPSSMPLCGNKSDMDPDRPVMYCMEGTPGYLSRFSSTSSLVETTERNCAKAVIAVAAEEELEVEERFGEETVDKGEATGVETSSVSVKKGKHNACEETPLMFSRATSVSSLSSFEVQSIHDDGSSVMSDFSRFTSGVISPSEIPDSPGQTAPGSPKHEATAATVQLPERIAGGRDGMFKETPKAWMEEGTPAEFSRGTSLSSLTIDDGWDATWHLRDRLRGDGKDSSETTGSEASRRTAKAKSSHLPKINQDQHRSAIPRPQMSKDSSVNHCITSNVTQGQLNGSETVSDLDGDQLLEQCISSAKPRPLARGRMGQADSKSAITGLAERGWVMQQRLMKTQNGSDQLVADGEVVHAYCTEGTPVCASASGSQSDLSQLSFPHSLAGATGVTIANQSPLNDSGDNSSENENMLELCIQSAMPKSHPNGARIGLAGRGSKHTHYHGSGQLCSNGTPSKPPGKVSAFSRNSLRPHCVARLGPVVKGPRPSVLKEGEVVEEVEEGESSDQFFVWATEGTPTAFSRADSLSPINDEMVLLENPLGGEPLVKGVNEVKQFPVEEMPVSTVSPFQATNGERKKSANLLINEGDLFVDNTVPGAKFSPNSSLSSLSVESFGEESTPTERALLEACISQGMPKGQKQGGLVVRQQRHIGRMQSHIPGASVVAPSHSHGLRQTTGIPLPKKSLSLSIVESCRQETEFASKGTEAESCKLRCESQANEKSISLYRNGSQSSSVNGAKCDDQRMDSSEINSSVPDFTGKRENHNDHEVTVDKCQSGETFVECVNVIKATQCSHNEYSQKMTESGVLATEALKVAEAVAAEGRLMSSDETSSLGSSMADLNHIKPPNFVMSETSSSLSHSGPNSLRPVKPATPPRRLECRHTRHVPEMVRRALGDAECCLTDPASAPSSCHSNLDNVGPPNFVDFEDMENSMLSVASITSEVAEQWSLTQDVDDTNCSHRVEESALRMVSLLRREALNAASTVTLVAGGDQETSTYQEVTEIDQDETLGPGGSDTEEDLPPDVPELPCDEELPCQTECGTESHLKKFSVHQAMRVAAWPTRESFTEDAVDVVDNPNMTPKGRRKSNFGHSDDRFKTITLSGRTGSFDQGGRNSDPPSPSSPRWEKRSPKLRRRDNPSRFLTQTITDATLTLSPELKNQNPGIGSRQPMRVRRQDDPERFLTRTIDVPLEEIMVRGECQLVDFQDRDCISDFTDFTPEQLQALEQEAHLVICTLNETREFMTADASDLVVEDNLLDIDTLSLISNEEDEATYLIHALDQSDHSSYDDEPHEKQRPRIVKPCNEESELSKGELETGKGIRGRRRALYSHPNTGSSAAAVASRSGLSRPGSACTPITNVRTVSSGSVRPCNFTTVPQTLNKPGSPKLPRATRTSALRQNSNIQRHESPISKSGHSSSASSTSGSSTTRLPVRSQSLVRPDTSDGTQSHSIYRQSTFTKDQMEGHPPSIVKQVLTSPKSLPKPKSSFFRRTQPSKPVIPLSLMSSPRTTIPRSESQEINRSVTSRFFNKSKSSSLPREIVPSMVSQSKEWSQGSTGKLSGKVTIKKDVTSRIASLWKRVERAQQKPTGKETKDSRVWISKGKESNQSTMIRSSTFEKISTLDQSVAEVSISPTSPTAMLPSSRTRLGLKLAKLRGGGRTTRSSPPSEASTPSTSDSTPSFPAPLSFPPSTLRCASELRVHDVSALRPRPATHPPSTNQTATESDEKRISRLGSFIVVDEQSADKCGTQPSLFYQTPGSSAVTSVTSRIPQLSKSPCPQLFSSICDSNGNAADSVMWPV